jgi:endoglucanase
MKTALRRRIFAVALSGVAVAATVAAVAVAPTPAGAATVGDGYWHTSGSQILDAAGNPVRIAGINWYGFETTDEVVHGLWGQDYKTIVGAVKSFGYNTLRIPFSDQMVEGSKVPNQISFFGQNGPINTDLQGLTSMQILDKIINYAGSSGLKVILDNHRSEDGNSAEQNGLWYTSAYPETTWINDWVALANRYKGNSTVVGMDLRNEPHTQSFSSYGTGSTWGTGNTATDWNLAAQKAGNAILAVNPSLLIAVEGISDWVNDSGQTVSDWWGGDLQPVATHPVQLSVANRLVYSPHDYGPHEFAQTWFNSSTTYASLSTNVWDKNWGYIAKQNIAPVWVGEFGTPNSATDASDTTPGSQGQWFSGIVQYIKANNLSWTYWALNGEDVYGLVDNQYDPTPVSAAKQSALATLQFPFGTPPSSPPPTSSMPISPSPSMSSPSMSPSPSPSISPSMSPSTTGGTCAVSYVKQSEWPGGVVVQLAITNTGTTAINGWTLAFTFPGDQHISNSWSSTFQQTGASATLKDAGYNATIPAGGNVAFGFQGTWTSNDAAPTSFTLNGAVCR